jgi:site-specific DNA-methyltransferase (adenine-specific)
MVEQVVVGSRVRLFHEDCIAGMQKQLAPRSVDVVVTSPPYNLGTEYGSYDDKGARSEYLCWLSRWALVVREVLTDDGSVFLNIGGKPSDPWGPLEVAMMMRQHFHLQNVIHWIKSIAFGDEPARGHVKPINSPRFLNDAHEYVFHLTRSGTTPLDKLAVGVPYADLSNLTRGTRGKNGNLRDRGNTWFIPYQTIQRRATDRPHPATFPVELARKCIQLHGVARTSVVLDPFLGIGHAGVAAVSLGMNFVGFEIDAEYLHAARSLIEAAA